MSISVSPQVGFVPTKLTVRARYDIPTTRGELCIVVDGPQSFASCWSTDGVGVSLVVRTFELRAPGEYAVVLRGMGRQTAAITVLLSGEQE